jgi:HAD superfamily hydrolase (TIGR01509 family)
VAGIEAVLFDMDGVLIDSEPAHMAALSGVLSDFGFPAPGVGDWEAVFLGRPDRDGLLDWFAAHGIDAPVEPLMDETLARFTDVFRDLVEPFEDGQWLARELRARGLPLALVSGARRAEIELTLATFDLGAVFAVSVSADDVARGKPDPEPYLRGAAALGVRPAACVVIEDAPAGVAAARAAGAAVIVVDRLQRPARFAPLTPFSRLDERALEAILALQGTPATRRQAR